MITRKRVKNTEIATRTISKLLEFQVLQIIPNRPAGFHGTPFSNYQTPITRPMVDTKYILTIHEHLNKKPKKQLSKRDVKNIYVVCNVFSTRYPKTGWIGLEMNLRASQIF